NFDGYDRARFLAGGQLGNGHHKLLDRARHPLGVAGDERRKIFGDDSLLPPVDPGIFVKASSKKLPKAIRTYLGPSPMIESNNGKIKALAKDLAKQSADKSAWEQVETIYQWVRENLKHEDGKVQGAASALKTRTAEHEDLTALF